LENSTIKSGFSKNGLTGWLQLFLLPSWYIFYMYFLADFFKL
jgi:hypothetical protein